MLIYSEQRLVPTDTNMLTISGHGGYFYIHRALYDQAVIINDIYKDDIPLLMQEISGSAQSRSDVDMFMEAAPSPINILGPYLLLVKEPLEDFVDMVGAIHVMSGPLNLRAMLKYPIEVRNVALFSLSIKEEYELAWDRFFRTTMPYNPEAVAYQPTVTPMNGTATTTVAYEEKEENLNIGADGEEYEDELAALMMACGDDFFDMPMDDEETTETTEDEQAPESVEASIPETAPEPEPVEPPKKVLTGLDALRNM